MGNETHSQPRVPSPGHSVDDAPLWLTQRAVSADSHETVASDHQKPSTNSRRKFDSFDAASCKGLGTGPKGKFEDPVLSAAAVGANVRKGKHSFEVKQRVFLQHQEDERRTQERIRTDNDWKSSLRRISRVAASTANTVLQVTVPVLKEAGSVVGASAKEFAQEVKMEWEKQGLDDKKIGVSKPFVAGTTAKTGHTGGDIPRARPLHVTHSLKTLTESAVSSEENFQNDQIIVIQSDAGDEPGVDRGSDVTSRHPEIDKIAQECSPQAIPQGDAIENEPKEKPTIEEGNGDPPGNFELEGVGDIAVVTPQAFSAGLVSYANAQFQEKLAEPVTTEQPERTTDEDFAREGLGGVLDNLDSPAASICRDQGHKSSLTNNVVLGSMLRQKSPTDDEFLNEGRVPIRMNHDGGGASEYNDQPGSSEVQERMSMVRLKSAQRLSAVTAALDKASQHARYVHPFFQANAASLWEATSKDENDSAMLSALHGHDQEILPALFGRTKDLFGFVLSTVSTGQVLELQNDEPVEHQKPRSIRTSIFENEILHGSTSVRSDTSSISTPPAPHGLVDDMSSNSSSSDDNHVAFMWDLYPPKQVVPHESCTFTVVNKEHDTPDVGSEVESLNERVVESLRIPAIDSVSFLSDPAPKRKSRTGKKTKRLSLEIPSLSNSCSNSGSNFPGEVGMIIESVPKIEVNPEALTLKWEKDIVGSFPGVPETEDISEAFEREDDIEEALFNFSSLENVDFLFKIDGFRCTESVGEILPSLLWNHLIASWKHQETWKELNSRPCTIQIKIGHVSIEKLGDDSVSSASTSRFLFHGTDIDIEDRLSEKSAYMALKECCGIKPDPVDGGSFTLSGYLREIGPLAFEKGIDLTDPNNFRQPIAKIEVGDEARGDDASCLEASALKNRGVLESIVSTVVDFSTQNNIDRLGFSGSATTSSVDIKSAAAIRRKAARKYDGNVARVFDALRAQVVFPDEGSLVCGLWQLWCMHKGQPILGSSPDQREGLEIIRVKNLFRTSHVGNACFQELPTGYRHILINIRLQTGIIAELQFQLLRFYQVLGAGGYQLHLDLVSERAVDHSATSETPNDARVLVPHHKIPSITKEIMLGCTIENSIPLVEDTQATIDTSLLSNVEQSKTLGSPSLSNNQRASGIAEKDSKKISDAKSVSAPGGIAAMAAAAAAKKRKPGLPSAGIAVNDTVSGAASNQDNANPGLSISVPARGGTAATAAAAAKRKGNTKLNDTSSPPGGIVMLSGVKDLQVVVEEKLETDKAVLAARRLARNGGDLEMVKRSILVAAMKVGSKDALASPRDFSALYGIYLLARRLLSLSSPDADIGLTSEIKEIQALARRLLVRSLAISNQAASVGMVGWLEYGTSNAFESNFSLPLEVLRELASSFAEEGDWDATCDVLGSLVLQCEQRLPAYHPIALSCLVDLAAAYSMAGRNASSERVFSRLSDLMAQYLAHHEALFFDHEQASAEFESNATRVIMFHNPEDIIEVLRDFASELLNQLSRRFLQKIPGNHPARLVNHSLAADALVVLANCVSAVQEKNIPTVKSKSTRRNKGTKGSVYYWSLAYKHYQHALRGWLQSGTLSDPMAASTTYSCARCLRELGMLDQALTLLNTLSSTMKETMAMAEEDPASPDACRRTQIFVLGLWLTATLTVEQNPDERGRMRALSLLHAASNALRHALGYMDDMDEAARVVFLDLYECIEDEACVLFDPLRSIPSDDSSVLAEEDPDATSDDWLSPMRHKRWYKMAKSRLNHVVRGPSSSTKKPAKILLI